MTPRHFHFCLKAALQVFVEGTSFSFLKTTMSVATNFPLLTFQMSLRQTSNCTCREEWDNQLVLFLTLGSAVLRPTKMSTRLFAWGKGGRCIGLTNLQPSRAVAMKSGNLNFLVLSGSLQACNWTALTLRLILSQCTVQKKKKRRYFILRMKRIEDVELHRSPL
jgi:hypothetical protein